jgi:hypothetical protein
MSFALFVDDQKAQPGITNRAGCPAKYPRSCVDRQKASLLAVGYTIKPCTTGGEKPIA